jgi:hypothetical protein
LPFHLFPNSIALLVLFSRRSCSKGLTWRDLAFIEHDVVKSGLRERKKKHLLGVVYGKATVSFIAQLFSSKLAKRSFAFEIFIKGVAGKKPTVAQFNKFSQAL